MPLKMVRKKSEFSIFESEFNSGRTVGGRFFKERLGGGEGGGQPLSGSFH